MNKVKIMLFKLSLSILFITTHSVSAQTLVEDNAALVFKYINDKKWTEAEKLANHFNDSALLKIVLSQRFLDTNYKQNRFEEVIKFIKRNPHWPQITALTTAAEEYLSSNTNTQAIFSWFKHNKPKTGKGYKFYALASATQSMSDELLSPIIRDGWIYGTLTANEALQYLANFAQFLREEDNVHRIDELLWESDIIAGQSLMGLVGANYQKSFAAQIAIINKNRNAERLFKQVPEKYYTAGLLFRYLESKKKQEPRSNIVKLFKKVHNTRDHSSKWCKLQLYYAREFLERKNFASSYQIAKLQFAETQEDIRETEWLAGWIALRFLRKPELALAHFHKFSTVAKTPISISRGAYWLARGNETKGDKEKALQFYRQAAKYPYTFYGQLAVIELKENKILLPSHPTIESRHKHIIENNEVIIATRLLIQYGKQALANIYAKTAVESISSPAEAVLIANIIKANSNPYYIVEFAKTASQHHVFIRDYAFPTPYNITNNPIEAALSYAIIRQESVFNKSAVSSANAMGLMQLVKNTACETAMSIGIQCNINKLKNDSEYNITLGTHHFSNLLKLHNGSYILAIASYNAGSHRIKRWIELFGDPRKMKNTKQVIDWLELIPYKETRNYVQRVLENIQVYRTIINKDNRLYLKQDLVL